MTFTDEEIEIVPLHETRHWQSCEYRVAGKKLFHERTYVRARPARGRRSAPTLADSFWLSGGPSLADATEQWFDVGGSLTEVEQVAARIGGTAHAIEEFYHDAPHDPPHFLAFNSTDEALAFCRTPTFDRLAFSEEKHP